MTNSKPTTRRPSNRVARKAWEAANRARAAAAPPAAPVAKPAPAKKKKAKKTIGLGPIKLGTKPPNPG